jgi:hypothetical protein
MRIVLGDLFDVDGVPPSLGGRVARERAGR